jgi:dCMP deaminase
MPETNNGEFFADYRKHLADEEAKSKQASLDAAGETDELVDELARLLLNLPPKQGRDEFGRHQWDDVYMAMAFVLTRRSIDPRTQHGGIIVSSDNRPLSWGCNGPLAGINDREVPLTAPDKYYDLLHAEENALTNYCGSRSDIFGATCYVTGECCHRCLRELMQKGIKRVVQGHVRSVMIHDADKAEYEREQASKARLIRLKKDVLVENMEPSEFTRDVLIEALAYYDRKADEHRSTQELPSVP